PILSPRDRGRGRGVQRRGVPTLGVAAVQRPFLLLRAQRAAWRVARAAVAEARHQIGAAVPLVGLAGRRRERLGAEVERLPDQHDRPKAQRWDQPVGRRALHDRPAGHQEGIERVEVGVGGIAEMVVGEGRIELGAVTAHALAHGALELRLAVAPDAGLGLRGDVGGVDRAEGRRDRPSAGVRLAAVDGVADIAVADLRQHGAALDLRAGGGRERAGRGRRRQRKRSGAGERQGPDGGSHGLGTWPWRLGSAFRRIPKAHDPRPWSRAMGEARPILRSHPALRGATPAAAAVLAFLVSLSTRVLNDGDSWWHVAAGRLMIATRTVLRTDPFSATLQGAPWFTHEWLSEVLLGGAFDLAGWSGVVVLTAAAAGLTAWILARE